MIVAVAIDDRGGMMFNHRRVSRDRAQQADLLDFCGERTLWMNAYSAPLFAGERITADEAFLQKAGPDEVCFVEDQPLQPSAERIDTLVLYRWNRTYPADMKLDLDLTAFALTETREFPGNSHETITREIYERRDIYGKAETEKETR